MTWKIARRKERSGKGSADLKTTGPADAVPVPLRAGPTASEAVAAAHAQCASVDQSLEIVFQAGRIGFRFPGQAPDPAARLDLDAEREPAVGGIS